MYDSDVSDEEWDLIKHYFDPVDDRGGTGSKHSKCDFVNEIFYLCDVLKAAAEKHPTRQAFSGDAGYRGSAAEFIETAS